MNRAGARWRADDMQTLHRMAGVVSMSELAKMLGRTETAVGNHCYKLGIVCADIFQGHETLSAAAKRLGVTRVIVHHALRMARVPIKRMVFRRNAQYRGKPPCKMWAESHDIDEAVAEYLKLETLNTAAKRVGVSREALMAWLKREGISPPRAGKYWRIHRDRVTEIAKKYLNLELLKHAAHRHGVTRTALAEWLRNAGVVNLGRHWRLDPAVVDRVVKEHQESETLHSAAIRTGISDPILQSWLEQSGFVRPKRYKAWWLNPADVDRVVADFRSREGISSAAARLGVSEATMSRWFARFAPLNRRFALFHPETANEVARKAMALNNTRLKVGVRKRLAAKVAA